MYRPRGKPSEPAPHRAPGRSNRQRAALKRGEPAGKPETERWTRPPLFLCWEASDQRKQADATQESGVSCVCSRGYFRALRGFPRSRCKTASAPNGHLPRKGLQCSIRFAYQAADAGHPVFWVEQARRRASNFVCRTRFNANNAQRRLKEERASSEKSRGRAELILATGWSVVIAPARDAAVAFSQRLNWWNREKTGGVAGALSKRVAAPACTGGEQPETECAECALGPSRSEAARCVEIEFCNQE